MHPSRSRALALACLAALLAASLGPAPARAEISAAAAGGVVIPWDGDRGYSVSADVLYRLPGKPWRFGGEFEFRRYKSEFFGVTGVQVEAYQMRILGEYLFDIGHVTPYVGLGLHTSVNDIDNHEIELARPLQRVDGTGTALGATAIAGVELPLADVISFFVETRLGVEAQVTDQDDDHHHHYDDDEDVDVEDLGGFSARGGVRIHF